MVIVSVSRFHTEINLFICMFGFWKSHTRTCHYMTFEGATPSYNKKIIVVNIPTIYCFAYDCRGDHWLVKLIQNIV